MANNQKHRPEDILSMFIEINGCWVWSGYVNPRGYGAMRLNKRLQRAHRVSYELFIEDIPSNLVIDHLCRNRACINPTHLEAVTAKENILRGVGIAAQFARSTHCPQGHSYSGSNLYIHPKRGNRGCKTCRKITSTKYYLENRVLVGTK